MRKNIFSYFANNMLTVIGVVLIWRGIWHLLDYIDVNVLGGDILTTAIGGILLGLAILYFPDGDLKELGRL